MGPRQAEQFVVFRFCSALITFFLSLVCIQVRETNEIGQQRGILTRCQHHTKKLIISERCFLSCVS